MRKGVFAAVAASLLLAGPARADVWDLDTIDDEDDSQATDNEVAHGMRQVHDLAAEAGVVDQDWYRVTSQPHSSYEVLVDGLTGDVFQGALPLDRVRPQTSTTLVLNSGIALPAGQGSARTLRWQNTSSSADEEFVRVTAHFTNCTTACTSADQYTIRFYETTGSIARFNNAGTQTTVLLLQNPTDYTITGRAYFWSSAGALLNSSAITLARRTLVALNTSTVAPGASGSITVSHDARYGDLSGKAVALEPSTGFSFDTPMAYRPY